MALKKIIFLILLAIVLYSIYFDITIGTLPAATTPAIADEQEASLPYKKIEVKAGDTLLSIIEHEEGRLPKPINTIILDFQELNNGLSPHELQIGKSYNFPVYSQ